MIVQRLLDSIVENNFNYILSENSYNQLEGTENNFDVDQIFYMKHSLRKILQRLLMESIKELLKSESCNDNLIFSRN